MATTGQSIFIVVCLIFTLLQIANAQSGCRDVWKMRADVHGRGGIPFSDGDSLERCQEICISVEQCVAIDWEPGNAHSQRCWILKSGGVGPTTRLGVIWHYDLRRNYCPRQTTPWTLPIPTTSGNGSHYEPRKSAVRTADVHAIRPAYIVMAGLGAGNLLLVVIAVVIICSYPLNIWQQQQQADKNGVGGGGRGSRGRGSRGGGGGGGGVVEDHEMTDVDHHRRPDYDDNYRDYQPEPEPLDAGYSDENDYNDKRYTSGGYDDDPSVTVEDNPYFNRSEMGEY